MVNCRLVQVWTEIMSFNAAASKGKHNPDGEIACYNELWQTDNLPYQAASQTGSPSKTWQSIASNVTLIFMQTVLQLPAVFTFIYYLITRYAGSIDYTADARKAWANLAGEGFQV